MTIDEESLTDAANGRHEAAESTGDAMTNSSFRLLALTILFPVLVIVALAVALVGCDAQLSVAKPAQVLATVTAPFGIAVDSTTVYVSQVFPSPLMTVPVGGGAASPLGVLQAEGHGIAVDERRLYWSDGQFLLACDKSNCTGSTVMLAAAQIGVLAIALDATNIYWTATGPGPSRVMKMDKNGGTPVDGGTSMDGGSVDGGGAGDGSAASADGNSAAGSPVEIATAGWPYNVAVDATNVYWIDQIQPGSGVLKAPIAGGPAVQLAVSDPIEPMGLALDDDNVYFANGEGTVFEVSKNGGPTHVVLSNLGQFPAGLATDATNLYVAASTKVVSIPLGGGAAHTLATGIAGAGGIALDATSVYVTDDEGDAVVRVAK
jgi:hypothetical protein